MKTGKSLVDLARELDRQNSVKRDFQADTRLLKVLSDENSESKLTIEVPTDQEINRFDIEPYAVRQMGQKLRLPMAYLDRCADYPELVAGTFNYLMKAEPEGRFVRTLDGKMRAYLSSSYRPMDNFDLFQAIFPALREAEVSIESCEVTHRRLYIKALIPGLEAEIPPPPGAVMGQGHNIFVDSVQGGLSIGNSETGFGRLALQPSIFTARCTNLAIFKNYEYAKVHLGRKRDSENDIREFLSDETRQMDDQVLWNKVHDLVAASMSGKIFHKIVKDLKESREQKIENNPVKAVEIFAKQFGLKEDETASTLENLVRSGDLSKYGLHAAVTQMSADVEDYDRATELEQLGGKVIELSPSEFKVFAKAA